MHDEIHKDPVEVQRQQQEAKARDLLEIDRDGDDERPVEEREGASEIWRQVRAAELAADRS